MEYTKPPLTLDQQVNLLLSRGMDGDRSLMTARLQSVNYYRLSGYWHPFRIADDADGAFKPGTTFETIWSRYVFDRRLRLLVMDAIERIEVAVRSLLAYHHAHQHGAFAYAEDPTSLPKMKPDKHSEFLLRVVDETKRSKETFVRHFKLKYGDRHTCLPVWMATEIMAFGTVLSFYRGAPHQVKQKVATTFGLPAFVFESWLLTLTVVRNICAHHGRLWNRENGVKPVIPRLEEYSDWHVPVRVRNDRLFAIMTICRHCLARIAPQSAWANRWKALLAEFPDIPLNTMGFPADWEQSRIWKEHGHGG